MGQLFETKESFFPQLEKFLKQSKTKDLKTSSYINDYANLRIKVGFGKGNPARVPWVAFLSGENTVQKGIYPVFLFFKDKDLLVLAYGISETKKPEKRWNISNGITISEYFNKSSLGNPPRYGGSFVYNVYSLEKGLNEIEINKDLDNIINFYKKSIYNQINEPNVTNDPKKINPKDSIGKVHKHIKNGGFTYHFEEIANFFLALKTKPFVILAGISGTGKTQLPRKFAEALGMGKDQVIQVPVRPDWTDGSDLLGFTGLDGEFKPKDLTLAIIKANEEPNKPFFFILDEMNLARVEHYFSDFLSIIETREWNQGERITTDPILRKEVLEKANNADKFSGLMWPENLYLIGTVNMDETTHAFSRKVLDRANSIEMNEVNLDWIENTSEKILPLTGIDNSFFKTRFLGSIDLTKNQKDSIENEIKILKDVNDILKGADLHFAYRVRDEVAFFLILNKEFGLMELKTAMDFQLVQKVLPRIHGSSERVQTVLVRLFNLLEGTEFSTSNFEYNQIEENVLEENLKYPRSSKKIIFMLKRYEDDRFTSFWL